MVGESNQNVFLNKIGASSYVEFELSEFEISRFDCKIPCILCNIIRVVPTYYTCSTSRLLPTPATGTPAADETFFNVAKQF